MSETLEQPHVVGQAEMRLATFYLDDLMLGLEIDQVQEINRVLDVTTVPHSPQQVLGVINLRGEVVTVINLRSVLGLEPSQSSADRRNLIVSHNGELIGLCVDRIADILTLPSADIMPAPTNISDIDGRYFSGVFTLDSEIVAILSLEELLDLTT